VSNGDPADLLNTLTQVAPDVLDLHGVDGPSAGRLARGHGATHVNRDAGPPHGARLFSDGSDWWWAHYPSDRSEDLGYVPLPGGTFDLSPGDAVNSVGLALNRIDELIARTIRPVRATWGIGVEVTLASLDLAALNVLLPDAEVGDTVLLTSQATSAEDGVYEVVDATPALTGRIANEPGDIVTMMSQYEGSGAMAYVVDKDGFFIAIDINAYNAAVAP
jgi:hypothetical protein